MDERRIQDLQRQLVSGTGGANSRKFKRVQPQSVFHESQFGFLDLTIEEHTFTAEFLDTNLLSLEKPRLQICK